MEKPSYTNFNYKKGKCVYCFTEIELKGGGYCVR